MLSPRWLRSNVPDNLVLLARLERGAIHQLPGTVLASLTTKYRSRPSY